MTTVTVETPVPTNITFEELEEYGSGHPFLLLHGGGGPQTVAGFARLLAERHSARVLVPTHPGFGGTPRPEGLDRIAALAEGYLALLERLDLSDVTVVGNSIGGWVAAEMAVRGGPRVSSFVLVDAVGIEVEGHPVADFFSLSLPELARLSRHDPAAFLEGLRHLPAPTEAERRVSNANREALRVYGGQPSMADPTLRARLGAVNTPTLVLWGESDRVVDPEYGQAYAAAIPGAEFRLLPEAGHLPQLETPETLLQAVWDFADAHATRRPTL